MSRRSVSRRLLSAILVISGGTGALTAGETDPIGEAISGRVREVFDQCREAVVRIESTDRHGRLAGTGFYADPSGTIYTVTGVLGDGEDITVMQGAKKMPAKMLVRDPRTGLALIKVEALTPFLSIGDSGAVSMAAPLVAIGYPRGVAETFSFGMVNGFDRHFLNRYFRTTHIRASIPVQPGLGGAPVVGLDGKVVGIVMAGTDGNTGCYVLPINAAEKIRTEFARFGELRPGWVGVAVEDLPAENTGSRAQVSGLIPETPAAQSGLRDGDILLQVGDVQISCREDILDASFFLTAGDQVPVVVLRDGEKQTFEIRSALDPSFERNTGTPVAESIRLDLSGN